MRELPSVEVLVGIGTTIPGWQCDAARAGTAVLARTTGTAHAVPLTSPRLEIFPFMNVLSPCGLIIFKCVRYKPLCGIQ